MSGRSGAMNAEVAELRAALSIALPLLREEAAVLISSEAVQRDGAYDLSTLGAGHAALAHDFLVVIREAERPVGRPQDGGPAWLDKIIDGKTP